MITDLPSLVDWQRTPDRAGRRRLRSAIRGGQPLGKTPPPLRYLPILAPVMPQQRCPRDPQLMATAQQRLSGQRCRVERPGQGPAVDRGSEPVQPTQDRGSGLDDLEAIAPGDPADLSA